MRQQRTKFIGVSVAVIAALAGVLAFAAGTRAASGNVCNTPTVNGGPASCVTQLVAPHFISTPGDKAISVTKFRNEAGIGGATATHVALAVTFPAATAVTVVGTPAVYVAAPGSSTFTQIQSDCTTSATLPTVVTCPVGNIAGAAQAKMIVEFTGSSGGQLKGEAQYGEGGGNPSNPPNDDQVNFDTLTVGGTSSGGCFDIPTGGTQSVTGGNSTQQTQVVAGPKSDGTLPCTFLDGGVKPSLSTMPGVTQVSFVEFPDLGTGFATVYMILTPIPSAFNLNRSPIFEDTSGTGSFSSFITVPACDRNGNIIGTVGIPPAGNDSCIFARTSLGHGNGQIGIHVFLASPFDQTYKG
jgi:hypothetical protein